ncbi:helix-turn-helix transcriptional regulator [Actinomadura viridis]|uniref:Transcriptional regulator with XRE-family HTH domain n=1 Tax=Actinomadura viridis TaxID=58110 RepID=A0A931GTF1_9ACTN|nr:helix-turn-helix transcriptional regulator [Actinomadura viridis]MBG6091939.1 transcriptional regulator with XRE-family HTH domain [Actinomadura viridis]
MAGGVESGSGADRRRRLAAELRRVRDLAGISGRELAQRIGLSQPTVSRIESGSKLPSVPEVLAWADATGATRETRDLLVALTESVFTEVRAPDTASRGRPLPQDDLRGVERAARRILVHQPSMIPGLLQTAEYARRVLMLAEPPCSPSELPNVLRAHMDRQLVLFDEGRTFRFLLTESALRWRPGSPGLLLAQLDRVASLSTLGNVSIGLIPQGTEAATIPAHGFVLVEHGEGEDGGALVMTETVHADLKVSDPEEIGLYRKRWSGLERMAVFGDEARAFLARIGADVRQSGDGRPADGRRADEPVDDR